MRTMSLMMTLAVAGGCQTDANPVDVEANSLDIARLSIAATDGDLVIRGVDVDGTEIAIATLHVGDVSWAPDVGVEPETVFGRSLTVQVGAEPSFEHASPGRDAVVLPLMSSAATAEFLQLEGVSHALRERGVRFDRNLVGTTTSEDELAYDLLAGSHECESCTYSAPCGPIACGANPNGDPGGIEEWQWVCCPTSFAERQCTGAGTCPHGGTYPNCQIVASCPTHSWSVANPDGTYRCANHCGLVGPGGCTTCWSSAWSTSCDVFNHAGVCTAEWE